MYTYEGERGGDNVKIHMLDTSLGMIEDLANPDVVIILATPPTLYDC